MLKLFRRKKVAVKVLLYGIVLLVGAAMLVYLVPGASTDVSLRDPQGLVAQVGDYALTQAEIQQHYRLRAEQLGTQSELFRQIILEQVIQELLTQRIVLYEADRLGLTVTEEEVRQRLRQIPYFYPNGEFVGADTYKLIVEREFRMSVSQFEQTLREQVLLAKLFQWVTAGASVAPAEIEREFRRRQERVKVEFVSFSPGELARAATPTEEELQTYFESHRDRYTLPATRSVRYVAVDYETMKRRVRVAPAEIEAFYQSRRAAYQSPERVRARHILLLLAAPEGELPREPAALRQRAEAALAELKQGKDFAALAKKYSDDAGSKEKGGEIGWVQRGQTVPALEQVLFAAAPGAAPQLVETGYGFHLVQVLEHQAERVKPLAEVRGEIEAAIREDKARTGAFEEARKVVNAVRAGKTLDDAAREAGWAVLETGRFERDAPFGPFGESKDFQEVAFSLPAESAGQPNAPVSEPVAVPPGYAVLQLKESSPARRARLDEVRAQVLRAWQEERGAELAREAARGLAEAAEKSGDLRAAAQKPGWTVKVSDLFGRDGFVKDLGAARDVAPVAFSLPVGGVSPALPAGNNWVVFRVMARQEADLSGLTDEARKAFGEALLEQKRNLAWTLFHESLKKKLEAEGKLKLNQAAIDNLKGRS